MRHWPVVCATGPRPHHLSPDVHGWVRRQLVYVAIKLRDEYGTTVGVSGMAIGVDQWWAQAVLDAGLQLWAYIPCPQQAALWKPEQQRHWQWLRSQASRERIFADQYSVQCLHARNRGMLDDSHAVVAAHRRDKVGGGTAACIREADRRGLPRINIDPIRRTVTLRC